MLQFIFSQFHCSMYKRPQRYYILSAVKQMCSRPSHTKGLNVSDVKFLSITCPFSSLSWESHRVSGVRWAVIILCWCAYLLQTRMEKHAGWLTRCVCDSCVFLSKCNLDIPKCPACHLNQRPELLDSFDPADVCTDCGQSDFHHISDALWLWCYATTTNMECELSKEINKKLRMWLQ